MQRVERKGRSVAMPLGRETRRSHVLALSLALLIVAAALVFQQVRAQQADTAADGRPLVTIKELMEKTITPATNAIWGAYEPPTSEEQWTALEEAAVTLLAAANVVAIGGTGPMDDEWAMQPAWKAFNGVMINAGRDALAAIRARDHDALLKASDVLYPPCEGCHELFNPGVVGAD